MFPMFGAGDNAQYKVPRSLRFNSADSTYLSRTPGTAGNRKTWTFSAWVKRGALGTTQAIFSGTVGNTTAGTDYGTAIRFDASNYLEVFDYTNTVYNFRLLTTQVFRDSSAWIHLVVALDTTQATAANRLKIYVNGVQVTSFSVATYPALNTDYNINSTTALHILGGGRSETTLTDYYNGYMAEVNFVDGSAITPSFFGNADLSTGSWIPKAYDFPGFISIDYLVVAGGGGTYGGYSGGGGGGGLLTATSVSFSRKIAHSIVVGAGGSSGRNNGSNSILGNVTALGGGYANGGGGNPSPASASGGSGGGGGEYGGTGGAGTAGQGSNGANGSTSYGSGGGGGGAGGVGTAGSSGTAGNGGIGVQSSISGVATYYAGGGGGWGTSVAGTGGSGGGGNGGRTTSATPAPTNGGTNTGGGAGGSQSAAGGATGGSGVIILKYPDTFTATFSAGVTASTTTSGGFKITTVTAAGPTDTVTFS